MNLKWHRLRKGKCAPAGTGLPKAPEGTPLGLSAMPFGRDEGTRMSYWAFKVTA